MAALRFSGLLVSVVLAALFTVVLVGRDPRTLTLLRVRAWYVLLGAFVLRASSLALTGEDVSRAAYIASVWLLVCGGITNLALPGAAWMTLGVTLNALVISSNGGTMPVSMEAANIARPRTELGPLHVEMSIDTPLAPLGDVIPLAITGNVYSIGDVLLGLGVFIFVVESSAPRHRPSS